MNSRLTIARTPALVSAARVQGPLRTSISRPAHSMKVMASLKVKESGTGVEFPLVERLWYVSFNVAENTNSCKLNLFDVQGWYRYEMYGCQQQGKEDSIRWN